MTSSTAFPSSVPLREFQIGMDQNQALSESLFTRQQQIVSLAGGTSDRWFGLLETIALNAAQTRAMMAFFASVQLNGLFNIADPKYPGADCGVAGGFVRGAGQSGSSLIVDGVGAGKTFLAGEYFQVRDEYKILKANATSNGSGIVTFSFWPVLRVSPADDDPVTFSSPKLLLKLTSLPPKRHNTESLKAFPMAVSFEEALIGS